MTTSVRSEDMSLRTALWKMKRSVPLVLTAALRQSRRYAGQVSSGREARGFAGLYFYAERGVADLLEFLYSEMGRFRMLQSDVGSYPVHCHAFGFGSETLRCADKPLRIIGNRLGAGSVIRCLGELAGSDKETTGTIPSLGLHRPNRDDLCVFVCRSREIRFGPQAAESYGRVSDKHALWVFVGEDVEPEWKYRTFVPAEGP